MPSALLITLAFAVPILVIAWPIIGQIVLDIRELALLGWIILWFALIVTWVMINMALHDRFGWYSEIHPHGPAIFLNFGAACLAFLTAYGAFNMHDKYGTEWRPIWRYKKRT